jgi:hypothetical protein
MKNSTLRSKILYWLALIALLNVGANAPLPKAAQTNAIVFAVIGDYGIAGQAEADVARLVKSWNPDFIVTVGDNNYPDGASYSLESNIGQYYSDYIFKYRGKYGKGSETRRFFPAVGNHDWHEDSLNPYLNYFNLPGNERFYDFAYGSVHFFILNSTEEEEDGNKADSGQGKWLKAELAKSTSAFNVVVTHYPPYSSGKHGSVPFMQWPFKEWGADAVLAGHNHVYERLQVNGLTYFVNGLGGDEVGNFRSAILPESLARYNADFGAMRVEAANDYMKFQFVTRNNLVVDEYVLGDSTPAVSAIASASPKLTNASALDFRVAFSESVSGVDVSDFALTASGLSGAYISAVNGANESYVVTVNAGAGVGNIRLDLIDNDSIINARGLPLGNSGTGNGNRSSEIYEVDTVAPTALAVKRVSASPTNAATADFAVTLSESVSGVDISDFSLSTSNAAGGAYIVSASGSGAEYLVTVNTGGADNILRLDMLGNGSVTDAAGNSLGGIFASGESYAVDKIPPVVFSILRANPNPSSAFYVDFNVSFSEPVANVDAADFVLSTTGVNGAYVTGIVGSGSAYVASVNTGNGSGELRLDLLNDFSIADAVGNRLASGSSGETYTLDKSAPVVLSILRAGAEATNAGSVNFNITFSDSVSGVDAADFTLNTTGITGAYVSGVTGADANYAVTVNTGAGDGTLRLAVVDDDSIINATSSQLGTIGIGNGNFISAESYTLDKTPPAILSILRASPDPSAAASVVYVVNFSEPVSGVDASDFTLNTIGGAFISAINGSGSSYVVAITTGAGFDSLRLDALDNDSISDAFGNPTSGVFASGETFTVNKVAPVVTSILRASPNPTSAASADFIVNFSEPVSGVDISDFSLTTTGVSGASITGVSGSNSSYVVSVVTGVNSGALRLDVVDNNSIVNSLGSALGGVNLNDGAFTAGETYEITKPVTASSDFPAPTIIAPAHDALLNTLAPNLSWTKISEAQYYEVVIARDSAAAQIVSTQSVNGTAFNASLPGDGTYYWRVRAYAMSGQPGKFSAIESFTVDTIPPLVPVLLSPLNETKLSARFKFTWTDSGATRYHIEIDNSADFSSPEWSSWRRDAFYQISSMQRGTYYWRVRAKDMADNWSAWSVVFKLTVP